MDELNQQYVINSLINQVANLSITNAQKDAVIAQLQDELEDVRKKKIEKMESAE